MGLLLSHDETSFLQQQDFWKVPLPNYPDEQWRVSLLLFLSTMGWMGVMGVLYYRAFSVALDASAQQRRRSKNHRGDGIPTLVPQTRTGASKNEFRHLVLALCGFALTVGSILVLLSPYHVFAGRGIFHVQGLFSTEECQTIQHHFSTNTPIMPERRRTTEDETSSQASLSTLLDVRLAPVVAAIYGIPIHNIQAVSMVVQSADVGELDQKSFEKISPSQISFSIALNDDGMESTSGSLYLYPSVLPSTTTNLQQPKNKLVGSLIFHPGHSKHSPPHAAERLHPLATWLNLNWLAAHAQQEGHTATVMQHDDPRLQEIYSLLARALITLGNWLQPHRSVHLVDDDDANRLRTWLDDNYRNYYNQNDIARASWFPSETVSDPETCAYDHSIPLDLPDNPAIWKPGDLNNMFQGIVETYPQVTILSRDPWIVSIDNFLTVSETDRLIQWGHHYGYERSYGIGQVIDQDTHQAQGVVSADRTSQNIWCQQECFEDAIVQGVFDKLQALTGIPTENAEAIQLLKYEEVGISVADD